MNELAQRLSTTPQGSGSWGALHAVFQRDLRIALRRRADTGSALVFFAIVVALFPLGVGPEFGLLRRMGPGVVWVAALLASMLALGRLFADDHADGTLEQMLLSPTPLALLVLACVGYTLFLMSLYYSREMSYYGMDRQAWFDFFWYRKQLLEAWLAR